MCSKHLLCCFWRLGSRQAALDLVPDKGQPGLAGNLLVVYITTCLQVPGVHVVKSVISLLYSCATARAARLMRDECSKLRTKRVT